MTQRVLGADVFAAPVDHQPLPPDEVDEGSPSTGVLEFGRVGGVDVGIWEMTEGIARDTEVDEIFVVLAGAGSVLFQDGSTVELRPGSAVRLLAGESTVWTITERLRKVYVSVT